ncbi:uncharacterized protein LOC119548530 isoform X2 [Drosophila subpulchrella]|uniref:uncharacterized protein LOC119548530 isoform X2 n=1 Tax=Drosophila subpulchrella TaxID=1486046 RepID=UPI0018A16C37|nr:uncharacterized protein LOC119548530 isoform X2 [Drosophila subpulchrella]
MKIAVKVQNPPEHCIVDKPQFLARIKNIKSDNFRLIAEVAKRRCLWDTNLAMAYRNQEAAAQWASVAQILQQDVTLCKKRFKGMRDSYRAEVRKIQQKRIQMSHWTYFRSLEFMRHLFDPERLVPFPPEPFEIDAELLETCDSPRLVDFSIDVDDDSVDFEIMEDIFRRESSVPQDSGSDGGSLIKPLVSRSPVARDLSPKLLSPICRRRKTSPEFDGPIPNGHTKQATPNSATEADLKNDSDYSFMVSMVPHVKLLSAISNLKFRMEMARVLVELRKEDQQLLEGAGREEGESAGGLPKLTPAPDSSFASPPEEPQYYPSNSNYHTGSPQSPSSYDFVDSSMIECDVKIENEALL